MSTTKGNGHQRPVQETSDPSRHHAQKSPKKKITGSITDVTHDEMDELIAMVDVEPETPEMLMEDESSSADLGLPIAPLPILTLKKNQVYGSYKGTLGSFEVDLRVDVDGPVALQKVSGDYYQVSGSTKSYFGSFLVNNIIKTTLNGVITVTGTATTTWNTSYRKIKIGIKQTTILSPMAPAFLQWFDVATNAAGALYVCNFYNRAYRTVKLEQDCTSGVAPFASYNTGSLLSGGSARVLSINSAFKEAGVDLINAGIANVVPIVNLTAPADRWSNAELHQSMVNNFSLYQNVSQWAVWLLHAYEHELGSGLYGIMFDQQGLQRQGCAVFYRGIGGSSAEQRRLQLYTTVHELGHCFNLLHSWQKSLATPPKPNIPASLSYMNYPWYFPGGPSTYWNSFPFQFDPVEIGHMRHGLRRHVIMGGDPFTVGSSLHDDHDHTNTFEEPIENHAPIYMEIESKPTYLLGEPVYLETKLKTSEDRGTKVIANLHADYGFIAIGIVKPGGHIAVYHPLAERCAMPNTAILNKDNPSIYDSTYIGFGKDGFYFDQVGTYQLRALYVHEDGSRIVSNTISIRVKNPMSKADDSIADMMLQTDVGYLMSFLGSDADYLKKGNDALQLISEKYSDHPLAIHADYVRGVNSQRTFKTITPDKKIEVRNPDFSSSEQLLSSVIDKSKGINGLDNINLNAAMQTLTKTYVKEGNQKAAESTAKDMVTYFGSLPIKPHVKEKVKKQSVKALAKE